MQKLVDSATKIAPTRPTPFSYDATELAALYRPVDPVYGLPIQRGRLHSLTSPTGHGKTAVVCTIIPAVALGLKIGVDAMTQGNVIACVGENPEDFYGRLPATVHELGIEMDRLRGRVRVVPHAFPIRERIDELREIARDMGGVALVTVDTNAAYFGYEDENDNVQQRMQAADLRELTRIEGNPAVVVPCHPVKNAGRDNLMPRGGGAFLAEVDTNLIVWKDGDITELSWQHKIRGPDFEAIRFELKVRDIPMHAGWDGKPAKTVVAVPITDAQAEVMQHRQLNDENRLLRVMRAAPGGSIATWAEQLQWLTPKGDPLKSKVSRLLDRLKGDKLAKKYRGKWTLTDAGRKAADEG